MTGKGSGSLRKRTITFAVVLLLAPVFSPSGFLQPTHAVSGTPSAPAGDPPLTINDVSPDASYGESGTGGPSQGGRIVSIVADPSTAGANIVYAAASSAGVWKSTDGAQNWAQSSTGLQTGSIRLQAALLAVDPTHLSSSGVASRLLYAAPDEDGRPNGPDGGLWVSLDAAATWQHISSLDTLLCASPNIRSVLFTGGQAFVSTDCGILQSADDNLATWSPLSMPPGFPSPALAGSGQTLFACQGNMIARSFTLGGSGSWTVTSLPAAGCQSLSVVPVPTVNAGQSQIDTVVVMTNNQPITVYVVDFNVNPTQLQTSQTPAGCPLGSGVSRVFAAPRPSSSSSGPGNAYDIFASDSGCFYQYDPSGSLEPSGSNPIFWHELDAPTCLYRSQNPPVCIHPDSWSMTFPSNYDPGPGRICSAYATSDGGVYVDNSQTQGCVGWRDKWVMADHGLHVLETFTMTGSRMLCPSSGCSAPLPGCSVPFVTCVALYVPTADNDVWGITAPEGSVPTGGDWVHYPCCGDASGVTVDPANPSVVIMGRELSPFVLYQGQTLVSPSPGNFVDDPLSQLDSNGILADLGGIPYFSGVSQVMTTPMVLPEAAPFDLIAIQRGSGTAPNVNYDVPETLMRNIGGTWFPIEPPNLQPFTDTCMATPTPALLGGCDIERVVTSGGHDNTVVYVLTSNWRNSGSSLTPAFPGKVWKAQVQGDASTGMITSWTSASGQISNAESLGEAVNLIVDPYDPNFLYATDMGSQTIKTSSDGGQTWHDDTTLTAIATNNGEFTFGCGEFDTPSSSSFFKNHCALSGMSFDVDNPNIRVAALFPGGIAFSRDNGADWMPLEGGLGQPILDTLPGAPHPGGLPSSVFYDSFNSIDPSLYVALANRGVVRINGPFNTLEAAEYKVQGLGRGHTVNVVDDTTSSTTVLTQGAGDTYQGTELFDSSLFQALSYHFVIDGQSSNEFTHILTSAETAVVIGTGVVSLTFNVIPTITNLRPDTSIVAMGQTITITATVANTGSEAGMEPSPSGSVLFSNSGGGTINGVNPCLLAEVSPGVSSCFTSYAAPSSSGTDDITGTYQPDNTAHASSSGVVSLQVISINIHGATSGTVSTDSSGNTILTLCCDINGKTVAVITYPPGTDFSGGAVNGVVSTAGGTTTVEVSGPTLPSGTTKSVSVEGSLDPINPTNTVCVVDSPSPPVSPNCSATDTSMDTIVFVTSAADFSTTYPCDGTTVTLGANAQPATPAFPESPDTRTYTCTPPSASSNFFTIAGLSFSRVQTMTAKLKIAQFFTDGGMNPLRTDPNGNPSVTVILSSNGVVKSTNPGVVLALVNATNMGTVALDSLKLSETLPLDWAVSPGWLPGTGAVHVFLELTNGTLVEITDPEMIKVSTSNPNTITVSIPDFRATSVGTSLTPGMSILISVDMTYSLKGTAQPIASYPRTYTGTVSVTAWAANSFVGNKAGGMTADSFIAHVKMP